MVKTQLKWQPIALLLLLAVIWGANMAVIKIGARELPPLFMAGIRSLVACMCLFIWMKVKRISLFPSRSILFHGIVIGLLFGTEFGLIYIALEFTLASRTYVLLYTAPFFVALGAHFFLPDDRLNPWKILGLLLAFAGVITLFTGGFGPISLRTLYGDFMALIAGFLWGVTTVYLKKYLAFKIVPLQSLFYQLLFSTPLLLALSYLLETPHFVGFEWITVFSMFYQCIIVAFLSFLLWFELIHRYPVSLLHAFSFFTPVFGVLISGIIILGEGITLRLIAALILVILGIMFVNRLPKSAINYGPKKIPNFD